MGAVDAIGRVVNIRVASSLSLCTLSSAKSRRFLDSTVTLVQWQCGLERDNMHVLYRFYWSSYPLTGCRGLLGTARCQRVSVWCSGGLTGERGGDGLGGLVPKRASHGGDSDHHRGACV